MDDLIAHHLNITHPYWWTRWATQLELQDFVSGISNRAALERRVASRLFLPILQAALAAGVVDAPIQGGKS